LQTGEYRDFAGQFPAWVRHLAVTWRWPLLISVFLHALVFWPGALHDAPSAEIAATTVRELKAKLMQPQAVALPQTIAVQESSVRRVPEIKAPRPTVNPLTQSRLAPTEDVVMSRVAVMQPTVGLDAGAVRSYRIALARLLGNGNLRAGLSPDMQGELQVGIAITVGGMLNQVEIVRSSGQPALDSHVVAAVRAAAREAIIPELMRGREFVVLLPVEVGPVLPATSAAVP
jgi:TonB family protein